MTQVQVQQAGVPLAQRRRRSPHQLVLLPLSQGRGHVDVGSAAVERGGGRLAVGARPPLAVEPVERSIAGDAPHPPAERPGLLEVAEPLPGDEEHVLGDLGGDVAVAHDAPRDVVHRVEPAVEQPAERLLVATARRHDEGGVGRTGRIAVLAGLRPHLVVISRHRPASQHASSPLTR